MALRSVVSCSGILRLMEGNWTAPLLPGLRRFSDQGRVLNEEERARETVYVQKMEKERLEKLKHKAEKEKADKSDRKGEEEGNKR